MRSLSLSVNSIRHTAHSLDTPEPRAIADETALATAAARYCANGSNLMEAASRP
jgi:hypothetical protein